MDSSSQSRSVSQTDDGFRKSGTGRRVLSAEQKAARASALANAGEAARIEAARERDRQERTDHAEPGEQEGEREERIPDYDPKDPYKFPALMPSSADRAVRSFEPGAFAEPDHRSDEWRYAPINGLRDFFRPFSASKRTRVSAAFDDGTPIGAGDGPVSFTRLVSHAGSVERPAGTVGKPTDRASAVEWQASTAAGSVYWLHVTGDAERPVVLRITGTSRDLDALHLVITAEAATSAKVVLLHTGLASLAEGVEIRTGQDSDVNVTSIQEWERGSRHLASHRITVGRGAQLQHNVVSLSGDVVRLRADPDFAGPQGFIDMLGIYFADPSSYMEHRTMVVHNHPECKSRVIYKGALDGKGARSAWVGNALILPTAPKTDSYELNRNLVLSPGAVANSEPQLEIENGDIVGAGHASSVGRFDDEQLFYLESRGIPEEEARKLVVRGFFDQLVVQIGIPSIEKELMDVIDRRLARGESKAMTEVLEEN